MGLTSGEGVAELPSDSGSGRPPPSPRARAPHPEASARAPPLGPPQAPPRLGPGPQALWDPEGGKSGQAAKGLIPPQGLPGLTSGSGACGVPFGLPRRPQLEAWQLLGCPPC